MSVALVLAEIDGDGTLTFSLRKVMCHLFHVSESTVSRMLSGQSPIEVEQYAVLARYLDDAFGERRLADQFHGTKSQIWPKLDTFTNDCINDDAADLIEAAGDAVRCYRSKDKQPAKVAWHRASEALANMGGEIDKLP